MTRKGNPNIPDFSRKPKPTERTTPNLKLAAVQKHPPQPKPHATSAKSGRRGQ